MADAEVCQLRVVGYFFDSVCSFMLAANGIDLGSKLLKLVEGLLVLLLFLNLLLDQLLVLFRVRVQLRVFRGLFLLRQLLELEVAIVDDGARAQNEIPGFPQLL